MLIFSPTRSVSWNSSFFSRHPHEPLTYTCKRPVTSACFQHAPLTPVVMTTWAHVLAAVAVFYCTSQAWIGHSFVTALTVTYLQGGYVVCCLATQSREVVNIFILNKFIISHKRSYHRCQCMETFNS